MELKLIFARHAGSAAFLLIVLNGIEMCNAHSLVHAFIPLLIVLNGIEIAYANALFRFRKYF